MTNQSASTEELPDNERRDAILDDVEEEVSDRGGTNELPDAVPAFLTDWSRSRRVAFGGAAIIGMATFLPWFSVGPFEIPMLGLETDGILTLLAAGGITLLVRRSWNQDTRSVAAFLGVGVATLTILYLVYPALGSSSPLLTAVTGQQLRPADGAVTVRSGLYMCLAGALTVVGAVMYSEHIESKSDQTAIDSAPDATEPAAPPSDDADERQPALLDAIASYMDEYPVVTDHELKYNVYPDHPLGFDDRDEWWNFVETELESHSKFEQLDTTGRRWALVECDERQSALHNS